MVTKKRSKVKRSRRKVRGFRKRSRAAKKGWETRRKREEAKREAAERLEFAEAPKEPQKPLTFEEAREKVLKEIGEYIDTFEPSRLERLVTTGELERRIPWALPAAIPREEETVEKEIEAKIRQTLRLYGRKSPALYDTVQDLADYFGIEERQIWEIYERIIAVG